MVKTSLVETDIEEGKRLLKALINAKNGASFRVKAAFWLYDTESQGWRLVIATPLVEEKGPLATYAHLRKVLGSVGPTTLSTLNISVVKPNDPLIRAFRAALRISPDPEGIRFSHSVVGRTYVEDAYLYRLPVR